MTRPRAFVAAARARGLRLITVGRKGEGIRLVETRVDGFAQRLVLAHDGSDVPGAPSARRRLPGGECAGGGRALRSRPAASRRACSRRSKASRAPRAGSTWSASRNGAPIFVDYAHKPDALAKALEALRPYVKRRLVVVFGCGGDRDQGKRPIMGAIAVEKADRVIVTDDNPRSENPAAIRGAILAAAPGASEIGDRAEAIRSAVARAARRRCPAGCRQGP